jgi:hypothetical protein
MLADTSLSVNEGGKKENAVTQEPKPGLEPRTTSTVDLTENPRQMRKVQYGIDCADLVHFSHWLYTC